MIGSQTEPNKVSLIMATQAIRFCDIGRPCQRYPFPILGSGQAVV